MPQITFSRELKDALSLLDQVMAPDNMGFYASLGTNYHYAVFGRDSIEAAEDIVALDRELPLRVLRTMASLQGTKFDDTSEEEPGKIHHEYRSLDFNNSELPDSTIKIFDELSSKWGRTERFMLYYGSVDSTPLFVRLLCLTAHYHGDDVLDEEVVNVYGKTSTLRDHGIDAVRWIIQKIDESDNGLITYQRKNPEGISNQVWKDSTTSYVHMSGEVSDYNKGVCASEVQAYAYDALMMMAKYTSDEEAELWHRQARDLQQRVLDTMWMESSLFFSMGLDRDEHGEWRQIDTLSSNAGLLLDSQLLLDLPSDVRERYVRPIVSRLMSGEFLTDVGVRCRSLSAAQIIDFPDYHGSFAIWPKETNDVMRGMLRHGYQGEATELANRTLESIVSHDEFYEFFYVDEHGHVRFPTDELHSELFKWDSRMSHPEPGQTWTISAFINALALLNSEDQSAKSDAAKNVAHVH